MLFFTAVVPFSAVFCGWGLVFGYVMIFGLYFKYFTPTSTLIIPQLREVCESYYDRREQPYQPPLYFWIDVSEFESDVGMGDFVSVKEHALIIACRYDDEEKTKDFHRGVDNDDETAETTDSTDQ